MFHIKKPTLSMKTKLLWSKFQDKEESEIITLLSMSLNTNPLLDTKTSLSMLNKEYKNKSHNKKLNMSLKLKLSMFLNIPLSILLKKKLIMFQ